MKKFAYYEEGNETIYTESEVKELYNTLVDDNQKSQGTTYESWLQEMIHMQILNIL